MVLAGAVLLLTIGCGLCQFQPTPVQSQGLQDIISQVSGSYVCESSEAFNTLVYISRSQICDRVGQCPLHDDEFRCPYHTANKPCPTEYYRCSDEAQRCIPRQQVCDGTNNCINGDDEKGCPGSGQYKCSDDARYLAKSQVCDGSNDCVNGEDEADCPVGGRYKCSDDSTTWIAKPQICDGIKNCANGEDEATCPKPKPECFEDQILCTFKSGMLGCANRCDGVVECYNGTDETVGACRCLNATVPCVLTNFTVGCATLCNNQAAGTQAECLDPRIDEPIETCETDKLHYFYEGCPVNYTRCNLTAGVLGCAKSCDDVKECVNGEDESSCGNRVPGCGDLWFSCLNISSCYYFEDTRTSYLSVKEKCKALGAEPVVIETKEENDCFIQYDKIPYDDDIEGWVGLIKRDDTWVVEATGQSPPFMAFASGEENEKGERCAAFDKDGWFANDCNRGVEPFCEKKIT